MRHYQNQIAETSIPVNFENEIVYLPEVVDGRSLRHLLNLRPNQIPVRITREGDYVPIADHDEYHMKPGDMLTKVNRIKNG